jgi:MSHA biogenesis protein MshL
MNRRIPSRLLFPALATLMLAGGAFAQDNAPAVNPVPAAPAVDTTAPVVASPLPPKVETSLSATAISSTLFSFRADNVPIKQALALFARANHLNIVPDLDVEGAVTVEFQDLPLDQAMHALLEANGYYFEADGRLLRVRNHETRLFQIDYIHVTRSGQGSNAVQISSGGNSNGGGSSGTTTGASGAGGGSNSNEGSTMTVTNTSTINFWGDLADQLKSMVSSSGSFTINSLAGTVLVRDSHSNVETIARFIASVTASIVRQIDLDVEIYEVALNDSSQLGVNWNYIADSLHTNFNTIPGAFGLGAGGGLIVQTPVYGTPPGDPGIRAQYQHGNLSAVLDALKQQGNLRVVSRPRLRTLNNQPAVVRVGEDLPVFIRQVVQSPGTPPVITTNETIQTVTVGTVLSITPQVSSDGLITLDITPAVSRLVRTDTSASGETNAPVIDIRQASSIVRVRDGATIIMGGLVQDSSSSTHRKIPVLGDIPFLGKAFSGEYKTSERTELVFFLTPRIIQDTAGEKSVKLAGF